jgi:hypothetical protein
VSAWVRVEDRTRYRRRRRRRRRKKRSLQGVYYSHSTWNQKRRGGDGISSDFFISQSPTEMVMEITIGVVRVRVHAVALIRGGGSCSSLLRGRSRT